MFKCIQCGEPHAIVKGAAEDELADSCKLILERMRCITTLEDGDAVDEFKAIRSKSVLFFTATWCGPCNEMKPVFEKIARQHSGSMGFGKIDVDQYAEATDDYNLSAVPTFLFFDGDEEVERFTGSDATRLEELVQKHVERE
jgi:thiol-disulfide isomerase/thioredoxin